MSADRHNNLLKFPENIARTFVRGVEYAKRHKNLLNYAEKFVRTFFKGKDYDMQTFFMFGKYTTEAMEEIHPERTETSKRIIEELGGKIVHMYALLGDHDLMIIVELPGIDEALRASVSLSMLTKISFTTSPAVHIDYFDVIIGQK
jgi:uncharacterized protein with GYD domain